MLVSQSCAGPLIGEFRHIWTVIKGEEVRIILAVMAAAARAVLHLRREASPQAREFAIAFVALLAAIIVMITANEASPALQCGAPGEEITLSSRR